MVGAVARPGVGAVSEPDGTPTTLVYHAGALGDFITALPAIAAWKRIRGSGRRGIRLILLGRPSHAVLAGELADTTWDAGSGRFASLFAADPSPEVRAALAFVDSALVFAPDGAGIARGLAAAGIREIVRQDPFPRERVHVVDYHLSLFDGAVPASADRMPRVMVDAVVSTVRPVVIHPGSGSPDKNWPIGRFVAAAEALAGAGPIAWILGPAEEEAGLAAAIAESRPPDDVAWRGLSLENLARRLAGARLLVGNDSGIAHLAAAVGCPVVVLFGASDPVVWSPRGRAVTVVGDGTGGMSVIGLDSVVRAARAALAADHPCSWAT